MQLPLQIRFRNFERSAAIESAVRKRAKQPERFDDRITSCRVTIESPHKHYHKGRLYHVVIDVRFPAREIVVSRKPDEKHAHEDVYVAIRDAFSAARRGLQDHVREERGKVKTHATPAHGRITDSTGREIYFHRNSLVNADFDGLETAAEVRFVEETGDEGPQASSAYLIGKHHIAG